MLVSVRVRNATLLAGLAVLVLVVVAGMMPSVASGAGWSVVPSPKLPGAVGELSAVSCVSARACTAVGDSNNSTGDDATLAEQWNGARWFVQSTPSTGYDQLLGVSCASASVCTAVGGGSTGVERRNGKSWVTQPTPQPPPRSGLFGVSCVSSSACFAVGAGNFGAGATAFVERWNGSRWFLQPTPALPSDTEESDLYGVSCVSARACIAVGDILNGHAVKPVAERWNGKRWAIQRTAHLPRVFYPSSLGGVSCVSPRACTAVGNYEHGEEGLNAPLAELWDGTRWVVQPIPNPAGAGSTLFGVSCTSASACMAVGDDN